MTDVRLDSAGIAEFLQSDAVTALTRQAANDVANAAQDTAGGDAIEVRVLPRTAAGGSLSPRTAYDVILAHPAGLRVQAKRGTLTRAAASAGLEVTARDAVR